MNGSGVKLKVHAIGTTRGPDDVLVTKIDASYGEHIDGADLEVAATLTVEGSRYSEHRKRVAERNLDMDHRDVNFLAAQQLMDEAIEHASGVEGS